ncbi:FAM151B [Cordylochernes scorpioides]|uniref:FAM151B n=1 Tax=Cordylochernes scorpioides TaxID=51811 RepID=A0ABY6KV60_9ARAC|nr:FAM151B [Cordylochernes scorpioides]
MSGKVEFIVADITMGSLKGCERPSVTMPIMAHPPTSTSDFSFRNFVTTAVSLQCQKVIRLDFKHIQAVEPALKVLKEFNDKVSTVKHTPYTREHTSLQRTIFICKITIFDYFATLRYSGILSSSPFISSLNHIKIQIEFPVWIHADVLEGFHQGSMKIGLPVNPRQLLKLVKDSNVTLELLSFGWTTSFKRDGRYTWSHVLDMLEILKEEGTSIPITFPVRAAFVGASIPQLQWLLGTLPQSSLTVWNGRFDIPDLEGLLRLRTMMPRNRVYYDLLSPLREQFNAKKNTVPEPPASLPMVPGEKYALTKKPVEIFQTTSSVVFAKNAGLYLINPPLSLSPDHSITINGYLEIFLRRRGFQNPPSPPPLVEPVTAQIMTAVGAVPQAIHQPLLPPGYARVYKRIGLAFQPVDESPLDCSHLIERSIFIFELKGPMYDSVIFRFHVNSSPEVRVDPPLYLPPGIQHSVHYQPEVLSIAGTFILGIWGSGGQASFAVYDMDLETQVKPHSATQSKEEKQVFEVFSRPLWQAPPIFPFASSYYLLLFLFLVL